MNVTDVKFRLLITTDNERTITSAFLIDRCSLMLSNKLHTNTLYEQQNLNQKIFGEMSHHWVFRSNKN